MILWAHQIEPLCTKPTDAAEHGGLGRVDADLPRAYHYETMQIRRLQLFCTGTRPWWRCVQSPKQHVRRSNVEFLLQPFHPMDSHLVGALVVIFLQTQNCVSMCFLKCALAKVQLQEQAKIADISFDLVGYCWTSFWSVASTVTCFQHVWVQCLKNIDHNLTRGKSQ